MRIELPRDLHRKLRRVADAHGVLFLEPLIVECVRRQLGDDPKPAADARPPKVTPKPHGTAARPWSDEDQQTMMRLYAAGLSDGAIARQLGRWQPVVSKRLRKLDLPPHARFQGGDATL